MSYPTLEQRIVLADAKIAQWEKLITEREELVKKAQQIVVDRQAALEATKEKLVKAKNYKEHLIEMQNRPARQPKVSKTSQYKKLDELLAAKGKTLEELLSELEQSFCRWSGGIFLFCQHVVFELTHRTIHFILPVRLSIKRPKPPTPCSL